MMMGQGNSRIQSQLKKILGDEHPGLAVTLTQAMTPPMRFPTWQPPYDAGAVLKKFDLRTAGQVVDHYVDRLLQMKLDEAKRQVLIASLSPPGRPFKADDPGVDYRIRGLIYLIASMPEYQVN